MNPMMSMMSPMIIQPETRTERQPPSRILLARDLLLDLHQKTLDRAVANDTAIEILPGSKLSSVEETLKVACCSTLEDFVLGRLAPTEEEAINLARYKKQNKGVPMSCVSCQGRQPNEDCVYCKGRGKVVIMPAEE